MLVQILQILILQAQIPLRVQTLLVLQTQLVLIQQAKIIPIYPQIILALTQQTQQIRIQLQETQLIVQVLKLVEMLLV